MIGEFGRSAGIMIVAAFQLTMGQAMPQSKCDILKIAEAYIAKRYPFFDTAGKTPVIAEAGNLWEVTYELPAGMLGGAPVLSIDKRTCTVVRARLTQ